MSPSRAKDLSNLVVIDCPNAPYIFCLRCCAIVSTMAQLHKHFKGRPHNITPGQLSKLLPARPDLQATIQGFVQSGNHPPEALPDDVPPMAGLPVEYGFECLVCPPMRPHRSNSRSMEAIHKHIRQQHDM